MIKILTTTVLILMLNACGVSSDSSSAQSISSTDGGTDVVDNNTGTTDDGTVDDGTVDTNTTDTNTGTTGITSTDNGFVVDDAEYDVNSCIINTTYIALSDTSLDPVSAFDVVNGVEISSKYPYSPNVDETKVAVFYPTLGQLLQNNAVNVYFEDYRLGFDKAWSSASNQLVYVRQPVAGTALYECYRYDLSSLETQSISGVKVYR